MTVWVTADWHLFHRRIRELEPSRPENFEKVILDNVRRLVGPDDLVYNLGDVTFGRRPETAEAMRDLPGRHELVLGNHDRSRTKTYFRECGFAAIHDWIILWGKNLSPTPAPPTKQETDDSIHDLLAKPPGARLDMAPLGPIVADLMNPRILLAHHPRSHPDVAKRFADSFLDLLVHGHSHSRPGDDPLAVCVSVERTNYEPVKLADVVAKWKENTKAGSSRSTAPCCGCICAVCESGHHAGFHSPNCLRAKGIY